MHGTQGRISIVKGLMRLLAGNGEVHPSLLREPQLARPTEVCRFHKKPDVAEGSPRYFRFL
jgi:hypothetical protein